VARAEGVEETLVAEWALSQPHLADQVGRAARAAVTKGWRWVGEMEEIASCMAWAGLPDGFHQAAADVFRRSPHLTGEFSNADAAETVLAALTYGIRAEPGPK
jgi:hypothetical protein